MLIPYNTDAPIYHLPIATAGLVVLNIAIFACTTAGAMTDEEFRLSAWLMLETQHINPLQWLTNNFMHADISHLVGNMFFLWGFGLVIEGKLGWWRFLGVYLLIGIIYGAVMQLSCCICGVETLILGASAVIFGLMGIAVIWAPKNDLNCFLFLGIFSRILEVPIQLFGVIYLGLQLLPLVMGGWRVSSELLHLTGLVIGLPVGIAMLKWNWVDCERWDIFNVMRGTNTRLISEKDADTERLLERTRQAQKREPVAQVVAKVTPNGEVPVAQVVTSNKRESIIAKSIDDAVRQGNWQVAVKLYQTQQKENPEWKLPTKVTCRLIGLLQKHKQWKSCLPFLDQVVRAAPKSTIEYRLLLAQVLVQVERKPQAAVKLLQQTKTLYNEQQHKRAMAIVKAAQQLVDAARGTGS